MKLWTDDATLSIGLELDDEPEDLDLTDGTGAKILDNAVEQMLAHVDAGRSPKDGQPWAPNAESTKRQKGHGRACWRSGGLLNPGNWLDGDRDIAPRSLRWTFRGPAYAPHVHNGNGSSAPARPLIGWTRAAEQHARETVDRLAAALAG